MAQQQNTFLGKLMAKIGENLGLLKDRSTRLQSQQRAATLALGKAKAALRDHLLDGDDNDAKATAALQAKVDGAASLLASLDDAVKAQTERVANAEREMAAEQAQANCKAASEKIAVDVAKIERQLPNVLAAMRALAADLNVYEIFRFEAGSIAKFAINAANEIETALSVAIPDLKGGVIAVREGKEKPPIPPAAVVKFTAPKAPATETVFLLRHLKFTDAQGKVQCLGKMRDHALPPHLAQKALKSGAAVPLSDPRRKSLSGSWGMIVPSESQCESLDATPSGTVAPIMHSTFEPMDRGPPVHGVMPVQRAPMVAARSAPVETPEN